jgi:DNA gyrase inhibitor GyrI
VALGLATGCKARAPAIDVARASLDLGEIPQQPADTSVTVTNTGDDTLKILGVYTSCGCTEAWVSDSILPPGTATTLSIRYDPTSMTPADTGSIYRGIYVQSDDPRRPEVTIELRAVVRAPETP